MCETKNANVSEKSIKLCGVRFCSQKKYNNIKGKADDFVDFHLLRVIFIT